MLVYIFSFCQQQYALVLAVEHILASLIFYSLLNLHDVKNIGCILTRIVNNGIKRGRRREFYCYLLPFVPQSYRNCGLNHAPVTFGVNDRIVDVIYYKFSVVFFFSNFVYDMVNRQPIIILLLYVYARVNGIFFNAAKIGSIVYRRYV